MIEVAKKTITIFFENKKLVGDSKQSNKRRSEKKKKTFEKYVAPMDFAEHLRKSGFSKNIKVDYGQFVRNGLHEKYCYICKNRWDVQIPEVC